MRLIRFIVLGLLAVAAGVGVAGAAPLGTISLYGTSNGLLPGAMLGQGRPGGDGNFWFLDNNRGVSPFGNKTIGSIDLTTHVINEYLLPDGKIPRFLGAGPDGALWVSLVATSAIEQVIPNGALPPTVNAFATRAGSGPNQLGKGPDGNLWFTDSGSPKAVGLICVTVSSLCTAADVTSHTSHEYSGGSPCSGSVPVCVGSLYAGSTPRFVAAGPDGNVWFTDNGSTPAIGMVNARTGRSAGRRRLERGRRGPLAGHDRRGPDRQPLVRRPVPAGPAVGELTPDYARGYGARRTANGLRTGSLVTARWRARIATCGSPPPGSHGRRRASRRYVTCSPATRTTTWRATRSTGPDPDLPG